MTAATNRGALGRMWCEFRAQSGSSEWTCSWSISHTRERVRSMACIGNRTRVWSMAQSGENSWGRTVSTSEVV